MEEAKTLADITIAPVGTPVVTPVVVAIQAVYLFRKNGTQRVFEVDTHHLKVMRNRSDLTYIGKTPLPIATP
jgi:hypothetical protein